jgi:ribosomal protein L29
MAEQKMKKPVKTEKKTAEKTAAKPAVKKTAEKPAVKAAEKKSVVVQSDSVKQIAELREKISTGRLQKRVGKLKNLTSISHLRHDLARLLTKERKTELEQE